jgi:tetratricopeptide (TPR) repeat protein
VEGVSRAPNQFGTGRAREFAQAGGEALRNRDWPRAEAAYRQALQLDPNNPEYWNNFAGALWEQRNPAGAAEAHRKAASLAPQDGRSHACLAGALFALGRRDEALSEAREALRLGYQDHWIFKELRLLSGGAAPVGTPAPIQRFIFDGLAPGPISGDCFLPQGLRLVPIRGTLHVEPPTIPPMVMPAGRTKVLMVDGGFVPQFAFDFDPPIKRFTITSVGVSGGASVPTWELTGFNRQGQVVASKGVLHHLPAAPETASLVAPGMVRIILSVDNRYGNTCWATYNCLPIAEIELER